MTSAGWATSHGSYTWFEACAVEAKARGNAPRRRISTNLRATSSFNTYHASWDYCTSDARIAHVVTSLQPGDVIQLFARAHFAGWVNFVKEARIEIFYEGVKSLGTATLDKSSNDMVQHQDPLANMPFESTDFSNYRVLDRNTQEIRLLVIHPGSFDDPITCSLVHSSLVGPDRFPFEAVSYCWGSLRSSTIIYLTDDVQQPHEISDKAFKKAFRVPESVGAALKHLRYDNGKSRIFWVDSICINQSDFDERASQVSLMTQIYSQAESVTIWLGVGEPSLHMAMDVIRDISNYKNHICPSGPSCHCPGGSHLVNPQEIALKKPESEYAVMVEILKVHLSTVSEDIRNRFRGPHELISYLFEQPWFRRVWVLQEALNAQSAFLHCGYNILPWEVLIDVNESLMNQFNGYTEGHHEPLTRMPLLWASLAEARREKKSSAIAFDTVSKKQGFSMRILNIFLDGLEFNATDPRDKLFALLGFGDETNGLGTLPPAIRPSYEKPANEVFADFTRWWIIEYRSLKILSAIHGNPGRTWQSGHCAQSEPEAVNRPTWAIGSQGTPFGAKRTLANLFTHNAASDTVPDPDLLQNNRDPLRLRLLGVRLSKIDDIASFPFYEDRQDMSELSSPYVNMFDPTANIATRITQKYDVISTEAVTPHHADARDHWTAHWLYGPRPLLSSIALKTNADGAESSQRVASQPKSSRTDSMNLDDDSNERHHRPGLYDTNLALPCHDPCFFISSDGLLGLCPSGARKDDLIVILYGGPVPYLLRELPRETADESMHHSSGCYEFVGECFVKDRMEGRIIEEQRRMNVDPEVFTLL